MSIKPSYAMLGMITATAAMTITTPTAVQAFGLSDYNLVVFEDLHSNSEVEGNTFIGGNLSGPSSNYCIKCYSGGSFTPFDGVGLKVAGDINGNPKQVNNGAGLEYGGSLNTPVNTNGGGSQTQNAPSGDRSSLTSFANCRFTTVLAD
ncbi:MAG: collagen-binding domain-containing protein [Cyanobacteria bacterium P01_F01_bin.150]